jgi:hypothetical protein
VAQGAGFEFKPQYHQKKKKKKKKKRWENSTMKIIKLCKKKLNKTQKDGKISHAHGLAELLL